jgi:hypothetical protein
MRKLFWTPERLAKTEDMIASGLTYDEIGRTYGKTAGAISDAMNRHRNIKGNPVSYLKGYDGPAIGLTQEDCRLREDAILGSARLLAEIERVFGVAA